ncbi:MAG: SDR family NAD(P)-dependent oxidoreductase [Proteobacteria bacterium]|nr:SDR family NAD(P)-dependent oxidoreductase [Pseudomonadota bacterium]
MNDKVVVITGGQGNLGRAVAQAFQAAGYKLAVIDHGAAPQAGESDRYLSVGEIDLTQWAHAERAMQTIVGRYGRIDVLVNIAGGFRWQTLADGDLAGWDQMYDINLKTAVTACKAALPCILKSGAGRIINVGAGAAAKAAAGMGAYAASKSGVLRLTESLAEEVKDRGVTVNAILPGTIDTPQNRKAMPKADPSKWVAAEAIADVVVFLASEGARAITGAAVPVAGRG